MNFNITTEYPAWYIAFCLLIAVSFAFLLYWKDKKFPEISSKLLLLMALLRSLGIFILSILLLNPLLQTILRELEKPIIIIAQDNSASIVANKDSTFYKTGYTAKLNELVSGLDEYEVKTFSFGDQVKEGIKNSFEDKKTDFSTLFEQLEIRFGKRNIGAIVIASDGLYNSGFNPVFSPLSFKSPVYTIAMGDSSIRKDLILTKVAHNRLVYLGNQFPLEISVDAKMCQGENSTLVVKKNNEVLFSKSLKVAEPFQSFTIPVQLDAKEIGVQAYHIQIEEVKGEVSTINNRKTVFIEVVDSRQKILILAAAPHPDVAAIKSAIEKNDNYEVESSLTTDFNKSLAGYNLVVLHQLPFINDQANSRFMTEIEKNKTPVLYLFGNGTDFRQFNKLQEGLTVNLRNASFSEAQALLNPNFSLFALSENAQKYIRQFPPLLVPFATFQKSNSLNVMASQKIGAVETDNPLITFNDNLENKSAIICGEGIWKWRLYDFSINHNHEAFDELIGKIVQYLSVKADKSFFRVNAKHSFDEGEPVEFDAEVYNESYELVNSVEVNIEIANSENKHFSYVFSKTSNAYHLDASAFPPGEYKYVAKTKLNDKIFSLKGVFIVNALQSEFINTVADHQLLYNLSKEHGGELFFPNELDRLKTALQNSQGIKTVSHSQKKLDEVINLRWIFFILLALFGMEWFFRKYHGSY